MNTLMAQMNMGGAQQETQAQPEAPQEPSEEDMIRKKQDAAFGDLFK